MVGTPNKGHGRMDKRHLELEALRLELESVQKRFEKLGFGLMEEGRRVQEQGLPPDHGLMKEAMQAADAFHRLAHKFQALAEKILPASTGEGPLALEDLLDICSRLEKHLDQVPPVPASVSDAGRLRQNFWEPALGPSWRSTRREWVPKLVPKPGRESGPEHEGGSSWETMERLIYRLLENGRLEPAYWLSCFAGQQRDGPAPVPPWLVKAVELAAVVQGDDGPAAKWLAHIYSSADYFSLLKEEGSPKRKTGLALLISVSLLRPALVAPRCGALDLLRRLCSETDLVTHCGFLKAFWEIKQPERNIALERSLDSLSGEVEIWENRHQNLSLASPMADRLWKTLQEKQGLLQSLIRPVRENDGHEADEVERLVQCLRQGDNLKKELAMFYRKEKKLKNQDIFHVPGSWQILVRLEEAIRLAERWLKLRQKTPQKAAYVRLVAEDDLHKAIGCAREEMAALAGREGQTPFLQAAAVLCGRLFESLEGEMTREDALLREYITPEEREALEMKDTPFLQQQPGWEPDEKTVERFSRALLELLQEKAGAAERIHVEDSTVPYGEAREKRPLPAGDQAGDQTGDPAGEEKNVTSLFSGENPLEAVQLTPQEKDFIKDVLKDLGSDGLDLDDSD